MAVVSFISETLVPHFSLLYGKAAGLFTGCGLARSIT